MQTQDPLNQRDEPLIDDVFFKKQVKIAKIKSAKVAIVPAIIALITSLLFSPFKTDFTSFIVSSLLFTVVPFGLFYPWIFYLGFGKKLLPEICKRYGPVEHMPYTYIRTDDVIDALNIARGHGPGLGSLRPRDD